MGYRIDTHQKKIVNSAGIPIGLPINDFGSRREIQLEGFTYESSLSIALYLIQPDLRDGQTMPVYYGTQWTSSNGVYTHSLKYGKEYLYGVTQNDTPARLVVVADSEVILDQEVLIDTITSIDEDAESLPTAGGGGGGGGDATWGSIKGQLSAQTDLYAALGARALATDLSALSGQVTTIGSNLSTLSGTVTTIGSNLSTLSGTVTSLTTTVNSKASKTDLNTLSGQVTSLTTTVNSKASQADLLALSGQLGDIETLLSNI